MAQIIQFPKVPHRRFEPTESQELQWDKETLDRVIERAKKAGAKPFKLNRIGPIEHE